MPLYTWNVTYYGGALETQGDANPIGNSAFFSPIAPLTQGFVFGVGDIWFNLDDIVCQMVTWTRVSAVSTTWTDITDPTTTWTPCDCSPYCG